MIFITVGTHHLPFNRLLSMIDRLINQKKIKEEVIIQYGTSTIKVKGAVSQQPSYDFDEFISLLKKARIVISHAGPATIYQCIVLAKKVPIVIPRIKKYGEHVSDHQLYFAQELSQEGKIHLSMDELALSQQLENFKPQKIKWQPAADIKPMLKDFLKTMG